MCYYVSPNVSLERYREEVHEVMSARSMNGETFIEGDINAKCLISF